MSREFKFRFYNGRSMKYPDNEQMGMVFFYAENPESYIKVMQYTGIKDKNDKEIYEGDIVFNEYLKIHQIVCELLVAHWIIDIDKVNDPLSKIVIIGNIYENPELLEGT